MKKSSISNAPLLANIKLFFPCKFTPQFNTINKNLEEADHGKVRYQKRNILFNNLYSHR